MDALKAAIASKKRPVPSDSTTSEPQKKYVRRGDVKVPSEPEPQKASSSKEGTPSTAAVSNSEQAAATSNPAVVSEVFNISNEEAIRRLRAKGQPIRLFGESDKERRLRLRALELLEEKELTEEEMGRNDLMKAMEQVGNAEEKERRREGITVGQKGLPDGEKLVDVSLVKKDPYKIYPQIYKCLKRMLKEWEQAMNERPDDVQASMQGKKVAAIQKQSADYLKPLFKQLKDRDLAPDVLQAIAEICHHMQLREYLKANDAYLRLSIGNAPWPIGVTMVGIHERSAREKIFSNQVAHVLNDEVSRKYIQSLKRVLTFAQTKYPPEDMSQL
ncbi:Prp18-domain-containing protein [Atractiella rhizophila]|nr:Prp18-domain-containing protein [Atractiella rhizophila]